MSSKYLGRVKHVLLEFEGELMTLDVVAVKGAIDDWAAYAGAPRFSDQIIHNHGYKLDEDRAAKLFPHLNRDKYRR